MLRAETVRRDVLRGNTGFAIGLVEEPEPVTFKLIMTPRANWAATAGKEFEDISLFRSNHVRNGG
jgi:hypothetical protein